MSIERPMFPRRADSVHASPPQFAIGQPESQTLTSEPLKPTNGDEVGMAWWNGLTEQERAKWLERAGSARPIDAWDAYRRSGAQPEAISTTRRTLLKVLGPVVAVSLASATAVTGAVTASGAAKTLPALADTDAQRLWAIRLQHCDRLRAVIPVWDAAREKLPAWAKPGRRYVDHEGNPCGEEVGWTMDQTIEPEAESAHAWRIVRPSTYDIQNDYEFWVRVFCDGNEANATSARATRDRRLAELEAREQEAKRLSDELGVPEFERQITEAADGVSDCEAELDDLDPTPDMAAALVMAELGTECPQDATITGENRNGTMRIAAAALEALLPNLSGLIREHAAFFVANRTTPLSAMPFNAA